MLSGILRATSRVSVPYPNTELLLVMVVAPVLLNVVFFCELAHIIPTLALTLTFSLTRTHARKLMLSQTDAHAHTRTPTLTLILTLIRTLTHTLTLTIICSTLTLTFTLILAPTLIPKSCGSPTSVLGSLMQLLAFGWC